MKAANIERKLFGGTCVNTGCIPTKALMAAVPSMPGIGKVPYLRTSDCAMCGRPPDMNMTGH